MKLVFLGTPEFAVPSLDILSESSHEVALVITQPDRPRGRGKKLVAPPVKVRAQELGLRVAQPVRVSTPEGVELISSAAPDAGVVCAYGEIISSEVLSLAPRGFFNVHASLLPKFRGAAPVHHAILCGETTTGVTIIRLVREMDAGDIVGAVEIKIEPDDTNGRLTKRLAGLGAGALVEALGRVEAGSAVFKPQDGLKATFAPKIAKQDAKIDWSCNPAFLERFVRAMSPAPGAFTFFTRRERQTRLVVGAARVARGTGSPGTVLVASNGRLVVAAGPASGDSRQDSGNRGQETGIRGQGSVLKPESYSLNPESRSLSQGQDTLGALELTELKPEGKRMISAPEFLRGYRIAAGSVFA